MRGRSPAFNALASTFENSNARNLSTPPPMIGKLYPKSVTPDSVNSASRSAAIAALSSTFEKKTLARDVNLPRSPKGDASHVFSHWIKNASSHSMMKFYVSH